jgi:hypothetical protein
MAGTVHKSYRISEEAARAVADIAEAEGVSASKAVEAAIFAYRDRNAGNGEKGAQGQHSAAQGPPANDSQSEAVAALSETIEALREQLEAKDGQINALMDITKAAQSLQMADKVKGRRGIKTRVKSLFSSSKGKE